MHKKKMLLLFLFASVIFLAACRPDPRKEAEAYATRSQADQQAANEEQQRLIEQQLHEEKMKQMELERQVEEANKQNKIKIKSMVLWTIGIFSCILIAAIFLYTARAYSIASVGVANAVSVAAMVKARQIALDPRTRQYPIYLPVGADNKQLAVNFNVHGVLALDEAHEPDRQMIATAGATQIAGVLASEAAKSNDAAGMAMINPPIVHSQTGDITLGSEYLPAGKE